MSQQTSLLLANTTVLHAMEATILTGGIYDHLLPHAEQVKVAHTLMLRASAAAKKKKIGLTWQDRRRRFGAPK